MTVRRPLVWSLLGVLLCSWLMGTVAATPPALAARGMEKVRHDRSDLTYLYRAQEAVETYVARPAAMDYLRTQTATITVEYINFPAEAQAAFQAAVEIWQALLNSPVPISVVASWEPLAKDILGGAGTINSFANFNGASQPDTFYPSALANKLAGGDLAPGEPDIKAVFNSTLSDWYFGTGQTPRDKLNFVSTVVHELGHGIGFAGTASVRNGVGQLGSRGLPRAYDRNVATGAGTPLTDTTRFPNPSAALAGQLQSNDLYWSGTGGAAANNSLRPKLFAPSDWQQGSSYSHLDERTYPAGAAGSLMTPQLAPGETVYDPGPIAMGVLADMGWTGGMSNPAQLCFSETGKCLKGRFAQYWLQNGGLAQQGYPITDEFEEVNPTDDKKYLTQYTERARFEYHPENAPPYDVLLGLLGREQLARYNGAVPATMPNSPLGTRCATFAQTGKQLCGVFLEYWEKNGGLAQQGLPLTDLFLETNPTDGKQYPTQYTERARFEYHVDLSNTPYIVLLGLLGNEQFKAKYPNGSPGTPSPSPSGSPGASPSPAPSASPSPVPSPTPSPTPSPVPSPSASPSPPAGGWGPTLAPLAGGQVYAHASGRFTISLPNSWEVLEANAEGVTIGITSPNAVCSAGAGPMPAGVTLANFDAALDILNGELDNYQQIAKDKVTVRGQPAYKRVISYTLEGRPIREEQVYFLAGNLFARVYCPTSPADFISLQPTFDGIAGSMKLSTMALTADPKTARLRQGFLRPAAGNHTWVEETIKADRRAVIARFFGTGTP